MDLELEQGLKEVAELIQRKVVEPSRRRAMSDAEETDEQKLAT